MLRITSQTLATRLTDDLGRLSNNQSRLTQQMASNSRLIDASDDVPATGRVMNYESEKRALQQYERNAQRGSTNIKVSTTALASIKSIGSTIFNLAPTASASGDTDLQASIAVQMDGLIEQAFSLSNNQVNGSYLFGSKETGAAPFTATRDPATGKITQVDYHGDSGAAPEIAISENAQVATTTNGTQNQELADFMNNLVKMRDSVLIDDKADINARQRTLGDDEDRITNMESALTASQFRINSTQAQNKTRFTQVADLSSADTEVDLAETIVKYQSSERSYQAALQAGSKLMQRSLLDYI